MIYFDGEFCEAVPLALDRGLQFGDGVFTTMLLRDGAVDFFPQHMKRLEEHAALLYITFLPFEIDAVKELIVRKGAMKGEYRLKMLVTGGDVSTLDLSPRSGWRIMTLTPIQEKRLLPLDVTVYPKPVCSISAKIKTLSYIDRLLMRRFAYEGGFDDVITLSPEGYILEGVFANIFWVKEKNMYYPDPSLPLMHGITLQQIALAAKKSGYSIFPVKSRVEDLQNAAIYFTSSVVGMLPVAKMDNKEQKMDLSFLESIDGCMQSLRVEFSQNFID